MSLLSAFKSFRRFRSHAGASNMISHPPPPVISSSNITLLDFRSAFAFKLILAALVLLLLIPFTASLASADDHIDNMCFIPQSEGGWAGLCFRDNHWTAGWYVYRYGETWTNNNRAWLAGDILGSSETKREVAAPPRGTEPRITGILPTIKSGTEITTLYPHGMTITASNEDGVHRSVITFRDSEHSIIFDHQAKTRTFVNGITGEKALQPYK